MFCPRCKCKYSKNIEGGPYCHIKLVTAYSSMNLVEIARVKYILEEENIDYFSKEQGMGSLYGAGNAAFGSVEILVREEDIGKVETLLKEFMVD
jgi:putative signal transducing protein